MTYLTRNQLAFVVTCSIAMAGCSSDSSTEGTGTSGPNEATDTTDTTDTTEPTDTGENAGYFDSSMFGSTLLSAILVDCELENGSSTTCHQVTFAANGVGDTEGNGTIGPFCPETVNTPRSEAGVGVYDGPTSPGFQSLIDAAIAMDADGYDIIDDEGNIRFDDLTDRSIDQSVSYCLSPPFDSTLEVTYLIPVTPEFRSEPLELGTIASIGFGLNGVPYKGNPPSVTIKLQLPSTLFLISLC